MASVPHSEELKQIMEDMGYSYDDLHSERGRLVFHSTGETFPLEFPTWKEVWDWASNVIID